MNWINNTLSRWLYALPFGIFGLFHFLNPQQMSAAVPGFIPGDVFWVYLTGVALILAAVSIIIEKRTQLACNLLAVMLVIFALTVALPALIGGNQMMMQGLLKDLSLAGGALFIAGRYEQRDFEPQSGESR